MMEVTMRKLHLMSLSIGLAVAACGDGPLPTATEGPKEGVVPTDQAGASRTGRGRAPSPSIGAEELVITNEFAWTETLHRAFVRTGSTSPHSLCSVKDAVNPGNIQLVTCGAREFAGQDGLIVSVFFFQPPAPEESVEVVVYQEGARPFSAPVFAPIE